MTKKNTVANTSSNRNSINSNAQLAPAPASQTVRHYQCPACLPSHTLPHSLQDGEWVAGTGKPEVFLTYGDEERLRGKAVYFVRAAEGAPIDTDKVRHMPTRAFVSVPAARVCRGFPGHTIA
jgi:hypothetical protein